MAHITVSTDGSQASNVAFEVALRVFSKPGDSFSVAHVFDTSKDYLPYNLREDYIRNQTEASLVSKFTKDKYSLCWQRKHEGSNVREQILDIAKDQKSDLVVMGYHGRKGPKEDGTLLGSVASHSVYYSPCSIAIIKQAKERVNYPDGFSWLVCVDGSTHSDFAYHKTVSLCNRTKDKITCIIVRNDVEQAGTFLTTLETTYKQHFANDGVNGEFIVLEKDTAIPKTILKYLDDVERDPDFVSCASYGLGHHTGTLLGSVAQSLIQKAKYNILCCKKSGQEQFKELFTNLSG